MASVTFQRGTRAEIEATAKQDGQILIETDQTNNKMYVDLQNNNRVRIGNSNVDDISGITDSLTATSSNIALSAAGGNNLQGQIDTLNSNLVNINNDLLSYIDVTGNKNSFVNSDSAFVYSKTGNKVCVQCLGSVNADVVMNAILCSSFPAPSFGYGVLTIVNLSTGTSATCMVNASGQLCAVEAILSSGNAFAISGSYICKL